MENIENVFNIVYKKYNDKDYFMTKEVIRNKLKYFKENNFPVKLSEVKAYIKSEKIKCYNMILKRIEEKKQGVIFPKREKFTWAIFNKIS